MMRKFLLVIFLALCIPTNSFGVIVVPLGDQIIIIPTKKGQVFFDYDPDSPIIFSGNVDGSSVAYLGSKDTSGIATKVSSILVNSENELGDNTILDFDDAGRLSRLSGEDGTIAFDYSTAGQVTVTVTNNNGDQQVANVSLSTIQAGSYETIDASTTLKSVSPKYPSTGYSATATATENVYTTKYGEITVSCDDSHSSQYINDSTPKNLQVAIQVGDVARYIPIVIDIDDLTGISKPKTKTTYRYGQSFLTDVADFSPWREQCLQEKGIVAQKHVALKDSINDGIGWLESKEVKEDICKDIVVGEVCLRDWILKGTNLLNSLTQGALKALDFVLTDGACTTADYDTYKQYTLDIQKDALLVARKTYKNGLYEDVTPIDFNLLQSDTLPAIKFDAEPTPTNVQLKILGANPDLSNELLDDKYIEFSATELQQGLQLAAGDVIYLKALDNFFDQQPSSSSLSNDRLDSQNYACATYSLKVTKDGKERLTSSFSNSTPIIGIPYFDESDDGLYKATLTVSNINTDSPIVTEKTFRIGGEDCSYGYSIKDTSKTFRKDCYNDLYPYSLTMMDYQNSEVNPDGILATDYKNKEIQNYSLVFDGNIPMLYRLWYLEGYRILYNDYGIRYFISWRTQRLNLDTNEYSNYYCRQGLPVEESGLDGYIYSEDNNGERTDHTDLNECISLVKQNIFSTLDIENPITCDEFWNHTDYLGNPVTCNDPQFQ